MSARRAKNLRSGDWNEDLGLLLLKALAAIAPVPRQEDFGLDAVATLLRDAGDNCVYAEESFYVQFKSDAVAPIVYKNHQIHWLQHLQLPLFMGIVSKNDSSLQLYPAHNLNVLLSPRGFEEALVHFGEGSLSSSGKRVDIYLGPPLLSFSIKKASDSNFKAKAYAILKAYLVAEYQNLTLRPVNVWRTIEWSTNRTPRVDNGHFVFVSRDTTIELKRIVNSLIPGFHALALFAGMTKSRATTEALVNLTRELKKAGFDFGKFDDFEEELIEWKEPKPFFPAHLLRPLTRKS